MRTPVIAGNWKMNNTKAATKALLTEFAPLVKDSKGVEIVVCPPFTALCAANHTLTDLGAANIGLGAQNVHWEASGAYTGEISAEMLTELNVKYAIIGHSERRQYFGETDEGVNKRTKAAHKAGLVPIVCVGESLETREAGNYLDFVENQVVAATAGMKAGCVAKMIIAYEPIWAIGTGKTATFEQAQEVCARIRATIAKAFGDETAAAIRVLYGGSVKPATIAGLMEKPDVDGALVGGAALKAKDFAAIVNY